MANITKYGLNKVALKGISQFVAFLIAISFVASSQNLVAQDENPFEDEGMEDDGLFGEEETPDEGEKPEKDAQEKEQPAEPEETGEGDEPDQEPEVTEEKTGKAEEEKIEEAPAETEKKSKTSAETEGEQEQKAEAEKDDEQESAEAPPEEDEQKAAQTKKKEGEKLGPGALPEDTEQVEIDLKPEELSMNERLRRQEHKMLAENMAGKAVELTRDNKFEKALEKFNKAKVAYKKVGMSIPGVKKKLAQLREQKQNVYVQWADYLVAQARRNLNTDKFDEAVSKLEKAKEVSPAREDKIDSFVERCQKLKEQIAFEEETSRKKVLEGQKAEEEKISKLMKKGKIFLENNQFSEARDKFKEILRLDPYRAEAMRYLRKVSNQMRAASNERRKATREERMAEAGWRWNQPVATVEKKKEERGQGPRRPGSKLGPIRQKLKSIYFEEISFEEATIHQVIQYLRSKSAELDDKGDGVNIIFKGQKSAGSPTAESEGSSAEEETGGEESGWGEDEGAGWGEEGSGGGGAAEGMAEEEAETGGGGDITLNMTKMPLGKVIEYVCMAANLKYRVRPNAVIIAPPEVPLAQMSTRYWTVDRTLFEGAGGGGGDGGDGDSDGGGDWGGGEDLEPSSSGGGTQDIGTKKLKSFFQGMGVAFPEEASISFHEASNKLVVQNTPDNLGKIDEVLENIRSTAVKPQVTIQAKFVEVTQTSMEGLGFDWLLTTGDGQFGDGAIWSAGNDFQTQVLKQTGNSYPFDANIMKGVRSPGDMLGTGGDNSVLALRTIINSLDFYNVIYALKSHEDVDVLSSPKVTTVSRETAVIRMVKTRKFPVSWEEPSIESGGENEGTQITPASPEFGEARDMGVVLTVTPVVSADNYTIKLQNLNPAVTQFVRYDKSFNTEMLLAGQTVEQKYNMPIISERTISTSVTIYDGETVVLGGMVRERVEDYKDKLPILGDVPMLGRLFQSTASSKEKSNLLIFVTARLVDPKGLPVRPSEKKSMPNFQKIPAQAGEGEESGAAGRGGGGRGAGASGAPGGSAARGGSSMSGGGAGAGGGGARR